MTTMEPMSQKQILEAIAKALAPKSKQKPEQATDGEMMQFWAGKIKSGAFVPQSAIKPQMARAMVKKGFVTAEELKNKGISF